MTQTALLLCVFNIKRFVSSVDIYYEFIMFISIGISAVIPNI